MLTLAVVLGAVVCGCQSAPRLAWTQDGAISGTRHGWTFTAAANKGGMTYYPDEGYYLDRGGKLAGPKVPLHDGQFGFFRYTFDAKSPVRCYWALDFYDVNDQRIPGDDYSNIPAGTAWGKTVSVFYGRPGMGCVLPFFQSEQALSIATPKIEAISASAAARWCDDLYAALPPLQYAPPNGRLALLPKTMDALKSGKPWRMLILGHSLFNDTYNSNFQALLKRRYPKSRLAVLWSGRGATGCEHYQSHVQEYVTDYRPDVVIVGGVVKGDDIAPIASVVAQIRKSPGCEILLMTEPFGWDIRPHQENDRTTPQPKQAVDPDAFFKNLDPKHPLPVGPMEFVELQRQFAASEKIAFLDAKSAWYQYIGASGTPWEWFNRDIAHANDRGKQVVARIVDRFFDDRMNP